MLGLPVQRRLALEPLAAADVRPLCRRTVPVRESDMDPYNVEKVADTVPEKVTTARMPLARGFSLTSNPMSSVSKLVLVDRPDERDPFSPARVGLCSPSARKRQRRIANRATQIKVASPISPLLSSGTMVRSDMGVFDFNLPRSPAKERASPRKRKKGKDRQGTWSGVRSRIDLASLL